MSVSERLAELGIELPAVVPPVAAYVPAKAHGDLVFTAGQLPMVSGALAGDGQGRRRPRARAGGGCRRRTRASARSTRSPRPRPPSAAWIG